jgi:hypothetical protein
MLYSTTLLHCQTLLPFLFFISLQIPPTLPPNPLSPRFLRSPNPKLSEGSTPVRRFTPLQSVKIFLHDQVIENENRSLRMKIGVEQKKRRRRKRVDSFSKLKFLFLLCQVSLQPFLLYNHSPSS